MDNSPLENSYFLQASRLSFPSHAKQCLIWMYTTYFDESGTHANSTVVTVAGYIATVEQWSSLEQHWRAALAEWGLEFFHMVDYAAGREQFAGWIEPERTRRLSHLVDIINEHVKCAFSNTTYREVFDKFADPLVKKAIGGAYGMCAGGCMRSVAAWADLNDIHDSIPHVFELGAEGSTEVLKAFQTAFNDEISRHRMHLVSIRFEDKRQMVPLQAADILAYETARDHANRLLPIEAQRDRRRVFQRLLEIPHYFGQHYDEISMRRMNSMYAKVGRLF